MSYNKSKGIRIFNKMDSEQRLINKWRNLPPNKQEEVMNFIEFLELRTLQIGSSLENTVTPNKTPTKNNLGERLREIREEVIASGVHLLNAEEIEQERKQGQTKIMMSNFY